jgi:hypothetical protein
MISNQDYLIQKYSEAREKIQEANTDTGLNYWRGVMDTYHNLLSTAFEGWAAPDSVGYYVFIEQMTYDEALRAISMRHLTKSLVS